MEIKSRTVNKGETFPCSFRAAKEAFKKTKIILNFSYTGRSFGTFTNTPDRFYVQKNVQGTVVSSIYCTGAENLLLNFYVIKSLEYSQKLKYEFESAILPILYNFYEDSLKTSVLRNRTQVMLVELLNGNFNIHKFDM